MNKDTLKIATDRKFYSPGDTVIFTVQNNGEQTLAFADSNLSLKIQNDDTGQSYSLDGQDVITTIESGQSKVIEWDTLKIRDEIRIGKYYASLTSIDFHDFPVVSAQTVFRLVNIV
jgi:hypothetical protein